MLLSFATHRAILAVSALIYFSAEAPAFAADVSSSVSIVKGALVLNRSTNTFDSTLKITNLSSAPLLSPLRLIISPSSSQITVANGTGLTEAQKPYIDIPLPGGLMNAGNGASSIVKFSNPAEIQFTVSYTAIATPDPSFNLPPDPGPAGKTTLLGIDSDNDGVRDDVQRFIVQTFPSSERLREAARAQGRLYSRTLTVAAGDRAAAAALDKEKSASQGCLWFLLGVDEGDRVRATLLAEVMNTQERWRSYSAFDDLLGGTVLQMPKRSAAECTFDIESTLN